MKILRIRNGNVSAEVTGTVRIGNDLIFQSFFSIRTAPHVGVGNEEDLLCSVLLQTGQTSFFTVNSYVVAVSKERLPNSPVIGDILTLSVNSVQLKLYPINLIKLFIPIAILAIIY